jgi:ATP-binding cassette subfamily A (ABC1) protein 3
VIIRDSVFQLGVGDGVCFGLLGPNGAGKSTAMAVLTGDVRATRGDAIINHSSVSSDLDSVYAKLGYCPQADGLIDLLTGRETLTMYAELKGIDPTLIPQLVERFLDAFTLRPHADKQTEQYSGGNKRKLSLAVALIGAPKVVLLDEPSTGVDPVSRRAMWSIISGAKKNRAVVLTTHALEEADVLCDRIGIMVNGALQCLGTSQHLKSKFGGMCCLKMCSLT